MGLSTKISLAMVVLTALCCHVVAFLPQHAPIRLLRATHTLRSSGNDNSNKGINPFRDVAEMFQNMDDVIDDFMCKRMGNGEVFYGKRKYKPSDRPNTDGKYNGMGLSDKSKIDEKRWIRDVRMEELRRKREADQLD